MYQFIEDGGGTFVDKFGVEKTIREGLWEWLGERSSSSPSNNTKSLIIEIKDITSISPTFVPNIQIIILTKIQTRSTESNINRRIAQKINPIGHKHKTDIRATENNAKNVTRYPKT